MSERVAEVYSLLVPLIDGRLIVPRTCVAEVIGYQLPAQVLGAPPWYLGTIQWNGKQVPLVSFETLSGALLPPASTRSPAPSGSTSTAIPGPRITQHSSSCCTVTAGRVSTGRYPACASMSSLLPSATVPFTLSRGG